MKSNATFNDTGFDIRINPETMNDGQFKMLVELVTSAQPALVDIASTPEGVHITLTKAAPAPATKSDKSESKADKK